MPPLFAKIGPPEVAAAGAAVGGLVYILLLLGVVSIGSWLAKVIDGPSNRRRAR